MRDRPQPAPLEIIARLENFKQRLKCELVAFAIDDASILVLYFGAALDDLLHDHED